MRHFASFAEANQYLTRYYRNNHTVYTLDNMQALMQSLGNLQNNLRVLHVAGTSGKTSTAYYTAALLSAAGYKTGLTVSPHVDQINERVQIDMQPLPEAEFCRSLAEFIELIEAGQVKPSWFELMVAFAYWYFAKNKVDYAVVEVGLGGLLDGTNVVTRTDKVCIITDIGLDHTNVLGKTIREIATQKAGIIQTSNHVFAYSQSQEVDTVLMQTAKHKRAEFHRVTAPKSAYLIDLPLFQQRNFYLARQAVDFTLQRDKQTALTPTQLKQAVAAYIPARMETIHRAGKTIIIDGAHNAQKIGSLVESITSKYGDRPIAALVAFVSGEDSRWQQGLDVLLPHVSQLVITSFAANQDLPRPSVVPAKIESYCHSKGFENVEVVPDPVQAFKRLEQHSEDPLLITGSFFLLNHIRPMLDLNKSTNDGHKDT